MLSYIFTSKISQSHWLSLSFPFCKVYDYDWGLRDDFMGEASLPLGQLAPQKWNDLVLTLSETGEHFNSIQGWLWGMSFIPKPSRVCLSKTRQQNVKKLSFNNKDKITANYRVFFWSESHYQLWLYIIFIGHIEIPIVLLLFEFNFQAGQSIWGNWALKSASRPFPQPVILKFDRFKGWNDHRVFCQPLFSEFIAKTHIFRDLSPHRPCQELLRIMLQPGGEEVAEKKGSHGQANSPFKWVSSKLYLCFHDDQW